MPEVDGVIFAVEITRDLDHGGTVQFLARLPRGIDITRDQEFELKRRLHDSMRAALLPLFEKPQ